MVLRAQGPPVMGPKEIKNMPFTLGESKEFLPAMIKPKLFTSCLCMPGTHCWCKSHPDSSRPAAPPLLVERCSAWSHAAPALLITCLTVSSQPLRARRAFLHFTEARSVLFEKQLSSQISDCETTALGFFFNLHTQYRLELQLVVKMGKPQLFNRFHLKDRLTVWRTEPIDFVIS